MTSTSSDASPVTASISPQADTAMRNSRLMRTLLSLVLLGLALLFSLFSVVNGYLDYTSPIEVSMRKMIAQSGQLLETDLSASGYECDAEQPFDSGMLGSMVLQGTTLLAALCLVGAWVTVVTRPSRGGSLESTGSANGGDDEPTPSESDAGPFFD